MMRSMEGMSLIVLFVLAHAASAAEIHVPRDHPSIQAAIDASQPGDVVVVVAAEVRGRAAIDSENLVVPLEAR